MIDGHQLEIPFESRIQAAFRAPERANIKSLWASLEPTLSQLPDEAQLQIGAQAIAQLAAVIESKAEHLLEEWEQRYRGSSLNEPVLSPDLLSGVLRQSMYLDLAEAVQVYAPPPRHVPAYHEPIESVVQEMDKAELLDLLEEEASVYAEAIAVAHAEDVTVWIEAIAHYLGTQVGTQMKDAVARVSVLEVQQALNRPLIEVWMGLLLGENAHLEQIDPDFYALSGLYIIFQSQGSEKRSRP
jgi:hypothetical protein